MQCLILKGLTWKFKQTFFWWFLLYPKNKIKLKVKPIQIVITGLIVSALVTAACDCNANGPVNVSAVTRVRGHKIEISIALSLSNGGARVPLFEGSVPHISLWRARYGAKCLVTRHQAPSQPVKLNSTSEALMKTQKSQAKKLQIPYLKRCRILMVWGHILPCNELLFWLKMG